MEAENIKENCFKVPDTGGGEDGDTSSDMELGSDSSLQGKFRVMLTDVLYYFFLTCAVHFIIESNGTPRN